MTRKNFSTFPRSPNNDDDTHPRTHNNFLSLATNERWRGENGNLYILWQTIKLSLACCWRWSEKRLKAREWRWWDKWMRDTTAIFYFFSFIPLLRIQCRRPLTTIFGLLLFAFSMFFRFVNYNRHIPSISTNSQWKPNYMRISITQCRLSVSLPLADKSEKSVFGFYLCAIEQRCSRATLINYSTFVLVVANKRSAAEYAQTFTANGIVFPQFFVRVSFHGNGMKIALMASSSGIRVELKVTQKTKAQLFLMRLHIYNSILPLYSLPLSNVYKPHNHSEFH